jgi:hypothetical protein
LSAPVYFNAMRFRDDKVRTGGAPHLLETPNPLGKGAKPLRCLRGINNPCSERQNIAPLPRDGWCGFDSYGVQGIAPLPPGGARGGQTAA